MAEHQSSPGAFSAISELATPSTSGSSPERKSFRSGYAREKYRRQRLIAQVEALTAENTQLKDDLELLSSLFEELKDLNESLADDLRQAKKRPGTSHFANVLMGVRHGG
jgi:chromosome segregation ATPase